MRVVEVVLLTPLPPLPAMRLAWLRRFRRRHLTRRNLAAIAVVALVSAAAPAAVIAFGASSGAGPGVASRAAGTKRVALVLPREPSTSEDVYAPYVDGLLEAGDPSVSENLVAGFRIGVREAVPDATILTDYSRTSSNPSVCEAIANRQIDQGSRVVFAPAGACGLGALSAAAVRGVWGIGVDVDRSYFDRTSSFPS